MAFTLDLWLCQALLHIYTISHFFSKLSRNDLENRGLIYVLGVRHVFFIMKSLRPVHQFIKWVTSLINKFLLVSLLLSFPLFSSLLLSYLFLSTPLLSSPSCLSLTPSPLSLLFLFLVYSPVKWNWRCQASPPNQTVKVIRTGMVQGYEIGT